MVYLVWGFLMLESVDLDVRHKPLRFWGEEFKISILFIKSP